MASLPTGQSTATSSCRPWSLSGSGGRLASRDDCPQNEEVATEERNEEYDVQESEPVLLNPPSSSSIPKPSQRSPNLAATIESPSQEEPRKCWICYTDETEDSPLNSEWRSPCPCALTAHEACLLDWLADLENPRTRKRNGQAAKILCPQCKSEIVISRPRSLVVDFVRWVERLAGRLVLPGMVFTLAGTVWAGCSAHGVYSMYLVFGTEDARRIIESSSEGSWSPGLTLGLPLIPLVLIFSRTRYAEGLLPAIPVLFFATHHPSGIEPLGGGDLWPPSAAMTFAALPYVKSFYSAFYERLFGERERKWIAEVQPRAGEGDTANGSQQGQNVANNQPGRRAAAATLGEVGDGQIVMEIELQVGLGEQDHDIPPNTADAPVDPAAVDGAERGPDENREAGRGHGQDRQILGRHRDELIHDTSNIADMVLGALLFPAISASMGGLLKLILPRSWITPPPLSPSTTSLLSSTALERGKVGLLQSRWGRSVVGGCLFVLLKDALVLYCRWKLAQTHRKRRVLNYNRLKKQMAR